MAEKLSDAVPAQGRAICVAEGGQEHHALVGRMGGEELGDLVVEESEAARTAAEGIRPKIE